MINIFKHEKRNENINDIYKTSFQNATEAILILNNLGEIIDSNIKFKNLFETESVSILTKKVLRLINDNVESLNQLVKIFQNRSDDLGVFAVEAKLIREGNNIPLKITFLNIKLEDKSPPFICVRFHDMTQEIRLKNINYIDLLTNLPNQQQAFLDISLYINKSQFQERKFALLLIAMDDFIQLRAYLGYKIVNTLVITIAKNLQFLAQELDGKTYHFTRNNFLLFIPDITTEEEIESIHQKITADLSKLTRDLEFGDLTFSMGATLFPQSGYGVDLLIDNSYKALDKAKKSGHGKIVVDKGLLEDNEILDELTLLKEMKFGLANNQFLLYYLPLIDMSTGKITGAEALVRWNHPERGLIPPASFIPLAQKTGFIVQLGQFIIHQAIKQQKQWEVLDFHNIEIAIKITLREIETGGLVSFIEDEFMTYNIRPELIRFEIPENVAMINTGVAKKEFELLKRLGVSLTLDNFGMGLSSLAYLRELPLDTLKINYSFVLDILNNKEHQKIVKAIITLGHNFDLKVVAAGIESQEIYSLLKSYGCDTAQGFYLSKPLPAFEFQEMIRDDISLIGGSSRVEKEKELSIDDYFDLYREKTKKELVFDLDKYDLDKFDAYGLK